MYAALRARFICSMIFYMCRLAAYIGPPISLAHFLLQPPHSLVRQSWEPREMTEARLNADGYGFGWFDPSGQPATFTSVMPIWGDTNLNALGASLFSPTWVANVRSATPGVAIAQANTQPFSDNEFLFLHNGYILNFAHSLRGRFRQALSPDVEAGVHGNSDSEYIFALLRNILARDLDLPLDEALLELFATLEAWLDGARALLNFVLTDGERIYAVRHALNAECPSLYFTTDDEAYPDASLVASEPLTDSKFWQPVPAHHFLILDPNQPPELLPL